MSSRNVDGAALAEADRQQITVGAAPLHTNGQPVEGAVVEIGGEVWYRIENVDRMDPFFVTVVSAGEPWLFASSTGALAAGRGAPERALFPYETVDRIHRAQGQTGGTTLVLASRDGGEASLWEPFTDRYAGLYRVRRCRAKSLRGDRLRFEETNESLGLTLVQTWATSERYGFVRTAEIANHGVGAVRVRLLDGVQNLMPYGITRTMHDTRSVLADAYKRNERLDSGLGIFALSAIPVDRAEPSEALLATTVWQTGLDADAVLLSTRQLGRFRRGEPVEDERLVRAERGAYLAHATLDLEPGERKRWTLVADIEQDASSVVALDAALADDADALRQSVREDVAAGADRLHHLVATADGEQETADAMTTARHRMNVLFNVMRGGVFDQGYTVERDDVRRFVAHHNAPVAEAHAALFRALHETLSVGELREAAQAGGAQLQRLVAQYLPLHFSRRHGDPSRPWNHFSIEVREADGSVQRGYEGNWRDIFQNWEALARSFPLYLEGMVTVFVNASTADGYNPYRITSRGIDWEVEEPDDPWSYIGYWGDHQIIYLLRLLAQLQAHRPDRLAALLGERRFSYANVPYRIKPYADLLRDPHDTVVYDEDEEERIAERVEAVGADGKLLWDDGGEVRLVTLVEKLLVPLLAKLTNLVPGGGIWMNTQRPEWNDANNALVGNGLSVVTLFAVRRYVAFLRDLLAGAEAAPLSAEVAALLADVTSALKDAAALSFPLSDADRQRVVDALGRAGSAYRERLYRDGLSGDTREVPVREIRAMLDDALAVADASLAQNRRGDGLVHSYNLLDVREDGIGVEHLHEMLEGQVAALDSGVLSAEESLRLLRALRASAMYRPDQHSYRLYPDRALPGFLEKNNVPEEAVESVPLFGDLIEAGDTSLVVRDVRRAVHFSGAFRNADDVEAALDALETTDHAEAARRDRQRVLDAFEAVFDHRAYTGRSGTFFGYEGLGSIYWHMVSKLALAAQETFWRAHADGADTLHALADAYYDVRAGLGGSKTPEAFGAFPADAYSHTPGHAGAKQPGMTGQVKEDILCRWGELGVLVEDGRVVFRPLLLRAGEFLTEPAAFDYVDADGDRQSLDLEAGQLGFTLCATPVVYRRAETLRVRVVGADGAVTEVEGAALPRALSAEVFGRTGAAARVEVDVPLGR
jgi:hypothetical protein